MGEFIEQVLKERDQFRRIICLAHNGFRYDSIPAARTFTDEQGLVNDVRMITQGNKIIEIMLRN